jgi:2-keto-3-deoxy-L-rhamnonate aldolase RhmA
MPIKTLKQKMAEGQEVRVMAISAFPSPKLIEVAGRFGDLDGVWIDQEHSGLPNQELEVLLLACRAAGLDAFARVAPTDYATVMRPMEGGASGVMMAQVRSVAEVEQAVRWVKYHPVGERGMFLGNYEAEFGAKPAPEHVADSNRDRWTVIQIETAEAVECVEGIAAVEGVDSLFVGPSDLSNNLGKPGNPMDTHVLSAIERIAAAAKANGKSWGVLSKTEEFALKCREMGCQLFSIAGDLDYINRGIAATKFAFPKFFS